MLNAIIGTAGHVDHGKTSLIKALSGIDTDRLKEEKKRGITIELGFANIKNDNGDVIGIIDVPGHEKFVKNMLAGIGGIDLVLFIIALDEGVKLQTIEHFEILKMLNINSGIIVYTKSDLVDENQYKLVDKQVDELVKNSFLEYAKRIKTSVYTGENIDALKNLIFDIIQKVEQKKQNKEIMRLPVDRVFTIDGFGTVVTGTLIEGSFDVNDELTLYPKGKDLNIRNIQNHSQNVDTAYAGQRIAINISNLKKNEIDRGDTICKKNSILVSHEIDVFIKMFSSTDKFIKNGDRIHFNYGSRQTECRIHLLSKDILKKNEFDFAHLNFDNDICVKKDDRFIVRFFSPVESIGGGYVIDPKSTKHKRKDENIINYLTRISNEDTYNQIIDFINMFSNKIFFKQDILLRLNINDEDFNENIKKILNDNKITSLDDNYYLSNNLYTNIVDNSKIILNEYHKANPILTGMNKDEFKNKLISKFKIDSDKIIESIINLMIKQKIIQNEKGCIKMFNYTGGIDENNIQLANKIEQTYLSQGIEVQKVNEIIEKYKDKKIARLIINDLSKNNILIKVDSDIYIHKDIFNKSLNSIYDYFEKHKSITLADVRDILHTSRKYALYFLDYCDKIKITKRVNDSRVLLKKILL